MRITIDTTQCTVEIDGRIPFRRGSATSKAMAALVDIVLAAASQEEPVVAADRLAEKLLEDGREGGGEEGHEELE